MPLLIPVLLGTAGLSLLLTLGLQATTYVLLARRPPRVGPTPPISILKPLKGADPDLYDNLASLARQDYPRFEIILGAADADDPALAVARRLQRNFAHIPIRVVSGTPALGYNPKVQNLAALARRARFEHLLISDADVRVDSGYLRATAAELADPDVGLVANVVVGTDERSLGGLFDNLHLTSFVATAVAAADVLLGHPCVVGKSMLFTRAGLDAVGGWAGVKDVLAEDYILGQRFSAAGKRVVISPHLVPVVNARRNLRGFINRHGRWMQMRRWINPAAYLGEPLLNPVPWLLATGVAGSVTASELSAGALALLVVGGIGLKCAGDDLLMRRMRGEHLGLRRLAWIPVKDLVVLALWLRGCVRRTVWWRGHALRLSAGSVLTAAPIRPRYELAGPTSDAPQPILPTAARRRPTRRLRRAHGA